MKHSVEVGLSFGLTSAVITTLGMMIGLNAGIHPFGVVVGGILTIAILDSLSDALVALLVMIATHFFRNSDFKKSWKYLTCTVHSCFSSY